MQSLIAEARRGARLFLHTFDKGLSQVMHFSERMKMRVILQSAILLLLPALAWSASLSKEEAIQTAERFVLENGYTNAPREKVKEQLDHESIEMIVEGKEAREQLLVARVDTLKPKAIGIRKGRKGGSDGWSVAFEYTNSSLNNTCRVVTMNSDGTSMRVEHVDGILSFFKGFDLD